MANTSESISSTTHGDDVLGGGSGENVLAKHAAFFDRNKDGVIYPWETFQGFRAIGAGLLLSFIAAIVINLGLSRKTRPTVIQLQIYDLRFRLSVSKGNIGSKFPNLLFPIEIKNIPKGKHGSDSGVYDKEGRFVPSKFEEIFSKHARTNSNGLTNEELSEMLKANREPKDYKGWFGAYIEWKIFFFLCKDKDGLLQKETIRGVYDGSIFEKMEKEKQYAGKKRA